ncbi:MAG: lysophospholipase [Oscillospiraceae bacterium]|nr:lysophospholipase [Oscillospiraceae bacterium]
MADFQEFFYPSKDGVHRIHASLWLPEGQPRAVVQIVHGVAEYAGRYGHFARYLADHGFAVCGEDHLGHGKTVDDGKYGYFGKKDGWTLVTADVRQLRVLMGERFPGAPYFLLGHSMGSFLARTYLCKYPGTVDGCILSGTGQEPPALVAAGRTAASAVCALRGPEAVSGLIDRLSLGAYNKQFKPNRTTADWICRDEAVVDAYLKDPFCTFKPTAGMFRDMMEGLQYISGEEGLANMDPRTPVYLFSGDQDPVGANGAGVRTVYGFFQAHGTRDLTMKLYPGGRHEMLNEINKGEVYADVLDWLEQRIERVRP